MKTVRQLLQGKPRVTLSIRPDATTHDAMKLMAEKNVGALLVLDGDSLVGILSERDFARKLFILEKSPRDIPVREVMTKQVIYVRPDQTGDDCMALMTEKRVRHLPVIENGKVIGVVSIGDLVKDTISEQQFIIQQLEHYIHG
ncbi:MAG: CBS domain-containing protein [Betaproteobacteria bacterium]|nr:CBS domain-containing protein [Betaproteobacteria bacterium]